MRNLILIFFVLFNMQIVYANVNNILPVMSIKFTHSRVYYKDSLIKTLNIISKDNFNPKFLILAKIKNPEFESMAKEYMNNILAEMIKFGIKKQDISYKLEIDKLHVNEIKILVK